MGVVRQVVLISLFVVGCRGGATQPQRGALDGKVTLNGQPVVQGSIRLMALSPEAVNVMAPIKDGAYHLEASQGPTKGKYRIEFSVPSAVKQRVPNDDIPGQFMEVAPETLPTRYHRDSKITLDYDPMQPQPFDYQLTSP